MSRDNAEIVRQVADAFNAGGFDAARPYFHPEIEWHEDPSFPESGVYRGVEAVAAYTEQFLSEFSEIRYDPVQVTEAAGENVLANMRITGTGKSSGAGFEVSAWWVMAFHDGRVIRAYAYLDRTAALEAAGLRE